MKSVQPKVLHPLAGRPLIEHVLRTVDELSAASTDSGRRARRRRGHGRAGFAAHAPVRRSVAAARHGPRAAADRAGARRQDGHRAAALRRRAAAAGRHAGAADRDASIRARGRDGPDGGARRPVRLRAHRARRAGKIVRIVEERDASGEERAIREINSGIYAFALAPLFDALARAGDRQRAGRVLPDRSRRRSTGGATSASRRCCIEAPDELRGVNSRVDLADLGRVLRARKNRALMLDGVTLEDPSTTYVDDDVDVGADTMIGPGVLLEGRTTHRRSGCRIHAGRAAHECDGRRRRHGARSLDHRRFDGRARRARSGRSRTSGRSRSSARTRTSATSSS